MTDFVGPLLQWLNANPQYAGLATFIISAAESVAIIGTIVPGSITMTAIGALAGAGVIPLYETIMWAILGAIVGDGISYWLGHYFKGRLPHVWPFRNYPGLLENGEKFVHKYGYMSVFIGRFVGPVRALVPLVAGMLGMKPLKFTVANVTSAILWAPAYMLPGILMGAASLELPPDIAIHVVLVLLLIGLFILLCMWFAYKFLQWCVYHTTHMQTEIWQWLKKSRFLFLTDLLKHHDSTKIRGQVGLGFYFLDTVVLFIALAIYVKLTGAENIMANDVIFHLFRGIRTPALDSFMLHITLLGQKQILIPVVIAVFAALYYGKHYRAAFHTLALGVLAGGSVFVLKHILRITRPWGILNSPETFSMPSGHVTLATCIYMGLAFLIASNVKRHHRWMVYTPAMLLVLGVSVSRLYLGAHWFTDVLGAWLLSTAILMVIVISYQRKKEEPINSLSLAVITLVTLCICYSVYNHHTYDRLIQDYSQIDYPQSQINMEDWWKMDGGLPAYRVSLFGFPSQQINTEWVGDLSAIQDSLQKEGWSLPPDRDFISVLHRIADIKSGEYLPLQSPQYLDRNPALTVVRQVNSNKNLLVFRLWSANRSIAITNDPLWVGIVAVVPRSYSWIIQSNPGYIEIDPALIFPLKTAISSWQWKMIILNQQKITQRILLIRPNGSMHKKQ